MNDQSVIAYVALGSNLGDRRANIEAAVRLLEAEQDVRVTKVSTLLENPAVGGPADSPAFLNAVAEIDTTRPPGELLKLLLSIESQLGRIRGDKWEPRLIDLDLLLYDDQIINEPDLQVPHPLMHHRRFVLEPLAEIAPNVMHPIARRSAAQLWRTFTP